MREAHRDWMSPRWRKLARDMSGERGRILAMVVAVAVSVVAVGAVLGAYAILTREIGASYLGTRPASATLEIHGADGVTAPLLAAVRALPEVAEADARGVVVARVRAGDDWRPLLLFVVDDFAALRLNTFRSQSGAWPPPPGTMLVERSALGMIGGAAPAREGDDVVVKTPHGSARAVRIAGLVHDPGLAPAWQERQGYAYVTRETAALLGEPAVLDELRFELVGAPADMRHVEAAAARVAATVIAAGGDVHQVRVPPPRLHPHQRQMNVILTMMLAFAAMALLLSAVLVATSLSALLARQVREIGVMKTVGATGPQIAALYLVLVVVVGAAASTLALPVGVAGARAFASSVALMLNFDLATVAEPAWVFAVQLLAGVLVPVAVAAVPVWRASRATVRDALDRHGVSADASALLRRPAFAALPQPVRSALRRPARLALTLALLSAGGAMFMTALDVKRSWLGALEKIPATRFYDVEVRLHEPASPALLAALARIDGVRRVEAWGYAPAAFARAGAIDVVRTYPDRGHGSLMALAPPPGTALVRFPLKQGRWLDDGDDGDDGDDRATAGAPTGAGASSAAAVRAAVVLNHAAFAQRPGLALGDDVALSLDGAPFAGRLVGVVEEIGAAGVAYLPPGAFAAATGDSSRVLRIAGDADAPRLLADIERVLDAQGARVDVVTPLAELHSAVGDHIAILINALSALAAVMAVVGILGLASAIGVGVVERTREIGVMKTLGATPARVRRLIVAEALVIGAASAVLAFLASLPLAWLLDVVIGTLGFLAPLDFHVDPWGVALWSVLVIALSALAALVPAARAAALRPRDALAALG